MDDHRVSIDRRTPRLHVPARAFRRARRRTRGGRSLWLVSYSVSQRTHELGIRVALGAVRGEITRLVLVQGLRLAIAGTVIGVAGAVAATRSLVGLIPSVQPNDPATFATVVVVLLIIALAATYLPARRAARVDPMIALRSE